MPDGTVILKLYERRANGRARHLRVSLGNWLVGLGVAVSRNGCGRPGYAARLKKQPSMNSGPA
jgi:hypothetical protein